MVKATIGPSAKTRSLVRSLGGEVNVSNAERVLSLAGGAAAIGYGLSRGNLLGVVTALAGAPFVWRAVSGHCAVKQAMSRRRVSSAL
jgi:uncharacterized membrane protein